MKFIDLFKAKDKRSPNRRRLTGCPFSSECYPMGYYVDKNGRGVCGGLIDSVEHLDCIRRCIFYTDLQSGVLRCADHFLTPQEAMQEARCLLAAASGSLEYSSAYKKYSDDLRKLRQDGDKTPQKVVLE